MAKRTDRRGLLIAFAAVAGVWGGGAAWRAWDARRLSFEDVPGLPGFRRVEGGAVTGAGLGDPLVGLSAGPELPRTEIADADVCAALHRAKGPGVPVASFSDYYCPYCRVLTTELITMERAGLVTVTWHELPLLSPASEVAARAALAAEMQGGYEALHTRLMRAVVQPNRAYLAEVAGSVGLEVNRLVADMDSPEVTRHLALSRGLAGRFGFWGTPALVVGRTAILGAVPTPRLSALIAHETTDWAGCT